jgi:DHA1 family bicyclomycin/chloramphenicol resistance-like MFS transporter
MTASRMLRAPDASSLLITLLITALVAAGTFSTSIYAPSMPTLVDELETTTDLVKLTLTVFLVGFALGQLVYGPISDRFGRRPVLMGGLLVFCLGNLACVAAPDIETMIAGRFLQALGACSGPVLGRAVVRDVHGPQGTARVLAWIGAAMAISPALGPTLGGHLHVWFGWRANFALLTVLGMLLFVAVSMFLRETNPRLDPDGTDWLRLFGNFRVLLGDRHFAGWLLCGSLIFAGLYVYIAIAPFLFIDRLEFRANTFGLLTVFTTSCYLAGTVSAARLTRRISVERMVLAGSIAALVGGVLMFAFAIETLSPVTILGPMMLFSYGMGLTLPNAMAGGMIPFPHMAGTASALLGFGQQGLAAAATVLAAALPQHSALVMGGLIAALAFGALLARVFLIGGGRG